MGIRTVRMNETSFIHEQITPRLAQIGTMWSTFCLSTGIKIQKTIQQTKILRNYVVDPPSLHSCVKFWFFLFFWFFWFFEWFFDLFPYLSKKSQKNVLRQNIQFFVVDPPHCIVTQNIAKRTYGIGKAITLSPGSWWGGALLESLPQHLENTFVTHD